jgi:hypothetical protein
MPLSPNEIRDRALHFAHDWKDAKAERAEAQTFWNEFFNVFGVTRRRVASFEARVVKVREQIREDGGFIDLLWPGVLLAEHKSKGKDLDSAYMQALSYMDGLQEREQPRYVIVSDFARIRIYDLEEGAQHEIALKELPKEFKLFGFIAGYSPSHIKAEDPVNIRAAEKMGKLYDHLQASGFTGHPLKVLLVRLLFCLFADDSTLFEPKGMLHEYLEQNTREDGSDLGALLALIFQILNTPIDKRHKILDERLAILPYVNGRLFEETLTIPSFDSKARQSLLNCSGLDWSRISPAIFGALFQSVMDPEARRNIGAHYTTEKNILKIIKPLFLDELREEFEKSKRSPKRLFELHKKLATLKFLDPACGCGNFLVIAYRELRLLELDILRAALEVERETGQKHVDIFQLVHVNVDQFYGIEIEEFPGQIAQVALWLTDHQMNLKISEEFGLYFHRLPLIHSPTIIFGHEHGNALRIDWNDVIPVEQVDYILGNPPFVGAKYMNEVQRSDMKHVCGKVISFGLLDYVTAWYIKAAHYLRGDEQGQRYIKDLFDVVAPAKRVKVAFVSTNSITQGEQVGVLWSELLRLGVKIHFAHRTFQWSSEARGKAAVHCVIAGFALFDTDKKWIYDYHDNQDVPHVIQARNINPYLVDAPDLFIGRRNEPVCNVPEMGIGNKPIDGGNYLFTEDEKLAFVEREPRAAKYFRPWLGADEFLYGYRRWCLWLGDCPPQELREMPLVMERVEKVRDFRLASKSMPTRKLADKPTRFHVENMPSGKYLVIPEVSSERRLYIPIGFLPPEILSSNLLKLVPNATLYHFGVLSSSMHMTWMRYVAGRLESRYRYSNQIVYNNYPWPENPTDKQRMIVEEKAQAVLDVRSQFPDAFLADLYDAVAMPPQLRKAHTELDKAVDTAYGKKNFTSETERIAFLFELYQRYTSLLPPEKPVRKRRSQRT